MGFLRNISVLFIANLVLGRIIEKDERASCTIYLDNSGSWPEDPPIIMDSNGNPILPEGRFDLDDRSITVAEGGILHLACSMSDFVNIPGSEFATARCIGGSQFDVSTNSNPNAGSFSFVELQCSNQPNSESLGKGSCGPGSVGTLLDIGFMTEGQILLPVMHVCFDKSSSRNIYSYHILDRRIAARDTGNDRPSFRSDGYFPFDVNAAYTQSQQADTIANLVGTGSYIDSTMYLARGHLSPNSDFVYFSWQDATYYYTDVAPQWQTFNAGNWLDLEDAVRDFVETRGITVKVYTGTNGILELNDVNGKPVQIRLHPQDNRLPVPMFYWKILVDESTKKGVGFVGVNNPYISESSIPSFKVCNTLDNHPIMQLISNPDDIKTGVLYSCEVRELEDAFEEVPSLGSLGLLS